MGNLGTTVLDWLFPSNFSLIAAGWLRDLNVLGLRDSNSRYVCLIKDTILVNAGLVSIEGAWVRDGYSLWVYSLATSKAETDPVLLFKITIVKWKLNGENGFFMSWCENL